MGSSGVTIACRIGAPSQRREFRAQAMHVRGSCPAEPLLHPRPARLRRLGDLDVQPSAAKLLHYLIAVQVGEFLDHGPKYVAKVPEIPDNLEIRADAEGVNGRRPLALVLALQVLEQPEALAFPFHVLAKTIAFARAERFC